MKRMPASNRLGNLGEVIKSIGVPPGALNPVFVYEDAATRNWARGVHERLERLAGEPLPATWWRIGDLAHPGVLAGAVSKTIRAGLVVIAARGGEGLPLPFYIWVNTWLRHRPPGTGALVALLAEPLSPGTHSGRVRTHLKAVASEGGMQLIMEELPAALMVPPRRRWTCSLSRFSELLLRGRLKPQAAGRAGASRRTGAPSVAWSISARGGLGRSGEI